MIADHQIKPLQLWAGRIGHIFLVLATLITATAGWTFGGGSDNLIMALVLAGIFGLCPWAVAYLIPFASIAWNSGRKGVAVLMALGAIVAGGMELRGELMVFAGKRASSSVEASLQNARYEDARKSVGVLEKQLATAQAKLDEQVSAGTSASYDAQIKAAEELAARESSKARNGCRQKCDEALKLAATLRAKQAIAIDRETKTEPEVARLTKELADARTVAGSTKAGDSMTVAEAEILASFWQASLTPSQGAKKWADNIAALFMAVFLLVVPPMLIFANHMDWTPKQKTKRPAGRFANIRARISAWLKGEAYTPPTGAGDVYVKLEGQPAQQTKVMLHIPQSRLQATRA